MPVLAEIRSALPSPVKSPVAIARGSLPAPVVTVPVPVKAPVPSPSLIAILSSPELATARSAKASPLKEPMTTELGASPTVTGAAAVNRPSPSPSRIETLSEPSLATATSGGPPLKFPTATEVGFEPTEMSPLKKLTAFA